MRRRAEAHLKRQKPKSGGPKTEGDTARLLHELQVHQVELEMQNEELRRTKDELAAALERYTELYDFPPAGLLTLARDGTIRQANLAAARLLAVERSRLLNRRLAVFVANEDRSTFDALLTRAFETHAPETGEERLSFKGKPPLSVQLRAFDSGEGQECRVVLMDITEIKRSEKALGDSERFARSVLNSLTAHIAVLDTQGVIIAVNEAWRRFAQDNGALHSEAYLGANYLTVCEGSLRREADESVARRCEACAP